MEPFSLPDSVSSDTAVFNANSLTAGASWHTWFKPLNKATATIICIGAGGGGGTGVIGANSTAAGGGGGASGAVAIVEIPLLFLPPRLYISVGYGASGAAGIGSYVSTAQAIDGANVIVYAPGGGAGGNASGATAGIAGVAQNIVNTGMVLGWPFIKTTLSVAQNGTAGGATGASVTGPAVLSVGLRVNGGSGGAGLPASATGGAAAGALNVPATPSYFIPHPGGTGGSATVPPGKGNTGFQLTAGANMVFYGGTGGGSTHGSATGAGLVQAAGGNGGIGSGGGGMGGALTGSAAAVASKGGPGLVMIVCS